MNPRANSLSSTPPGSVSSTNDRAPPVEPRRQSPSDTRFSERAAQARSPSKAPSKPAERDRTQRKDAVLNGASRGMLLLGDGAMLASLGFGLAPSPAKVAPKAPAVGAATSTSGGAGLEALRTGRGEGGSTYLHATVASNGGGRFAGVELRAVEQHGRVTIQLSAPDATSEASLRAALTELRASLSSRGLDGVQVELAPRTPEHTGGHPGDPQERRHGAPPEDEEEAPAPRDKGLRAAAQRAGARASTEPGAHGDATECW